MDGNNIDNNLNNNSIHSEDLIIESQFNNLENECQDNNNNNINNNSSCVSQSVSGNAFNENNNLEEEILNTTFSK